MKITEYEYEQKSTQYVVGHATFYFPGPEFGDKSNWTGTFNNQNAC